MLRPVDEEVLDRLGLVHDVEQIGPMLHLRIRNYRLPAGLSLTETDLLVQIPGGFPDVGPDMFWCAPAVHGERGAPPGTSETTIGATTWQRWSRHIGAAWRPGIDDLETYLIYIRRCLVGEAATSPAPVAA